MESEANAVGVVGVVIVRVRVHIAEVVGVAPIRRTLPPPVRRTRQQYHDRTRISVRADS